MASLASFDDIAAQCGSTLTLEERAALEIGMQKRKNEEALTNIQVWGKITGAEDDYVIAVGFLPSRDYPKKKFYFASSKDFVLQALPDLTPEFAAKSAALSGPFSGDPSKLLDADAEEDEEEEEEKEGVVKPPKFSEMHRVAYAVGNIDAATSIVPRGALMVDAVHNVLHNRSFAGLSATEAGNLDSYLHLREPASATRKASLKQSGLVSGADFLDPLSEDAPKGIWRLRVDQARGQVSLRSLLYPGYFFVHRLGTPSFVGAYMGDGQVNKDIGFMI